MQQQKLAVFTTSEEFFKRIAGVVPRDLVKVEKVGSQQDFSVPAGTIMALVDHSWPGPVEPLLEKLAAGAVYTVFSAPEQELGETIPQFLLDGVVDDVLLVPIRPVELVSKIRHATHLSRVNELFAANADLKTLIEKFEEDLRVARGIQRSLIPEKFPQVPGLKVIHKYLSGLKSGGDYLDFFEFEDKTHVGILMSDSSGYGLSSAFMSVILRLAIKLSKDEARSPSATVAHIFEELQVTMKPKENLAIFYGVLNRKTLELSYVSAGPIRFVHQTSGTLAGTQAAATAPTVEYHDRSKLAVAPLQKGEPVILKDEALRLNPGDRMVVFSDGFAEGFQKDSAVDERAIEALFRKAYADDPIEIINDFNFRVKQKFEAEDDMPAQDCSVMVIDVEKRAMRLAK